MTTLVLVRHGETDWNLHRRVQGHSDPPLNDTGRAQARALAEALAGEQIDAIYSSDLRRAHETARIVAERRGLEVTAVRGLRERNFGSWEGLTDGEVLERFPSAAYGPWGDGETREEMCARVTEALRAIAEAHPGGTVLVVTHGGPMRSLLSEIHEGDVGSIGNCEIARVRVDGAAFRAG